MIRRGTRETLRYDFIHQKGFVFETLIVTCTHGGGAISSEFLRNLI